MKITQNNWVKQQILKFGFVSRNEALAYRITRLASRINDLKQAGMQLEGKREGKDYIYYTSM